MMGITILYMHCKINITLWEFSLFLAIFPNLEPLRLRGEGLIFNVEPLRGDKITQCILILYAYDQKYYFYGSSQIFFFYNAFPRFSLYIPNIRLYIRIYMDFEGFEDSAKENC